MSNLSSSDLERIGQKQLISLVKRGIISVMTDYPYPTFAMPTNKFDTPEYIAVAHLAGKPISISGASRTYDVPRVTIGQWMQKGLIRKIGMDKNRVLIDEADVAYCAEIRRKNPGAGKWLFNPDGTPYISK